MCISEYEKYKHNLKIPTRNDIIRLSRKNPNLYAILNRWHYGEITFEEAMRFTASHMTKLNLDLMDKVLQLKMEMPPPPIVLDKDNA